MTARRTPHTPHVRLALALSLSEQESCEAFINDRENKPAELIAKYIDAMLRTGRKACSCCRLGVLAQVACTRQLLVPLLLARPIKTE